MTEYNPKYGLSDKEKDEILTAALIAIAKGKPYPKRIINRYDERIESSAYEALVEKGFLRKDGSGYTLTHLGRTRSNDGYVIPEVHENKERDKRITTANRIAYAALFVAAIDAVLHAVQILS